MWHAQAVKRDPKKLSKSWSMIGMIHLMKKEYFKSMHAYDKLPVQTKVHTRGGSTLY